MKRRKFLEIAKTSCVGLVLALIGHKKEPKPKVVIETSIDDELTREFAEAVANDWDFIIGDSVGKPLGILKNGATEASLGGYLVPQEHAHFLGRLKEKGIVVYKKTINFDWKAYHDKTT